jgi:hypothetical protein
VTTSAWTCQPCAAAARNSSPTRSAPAAHWRPIAPSPRRQHWPQGALSVAYDGADLPTELFAKFSRDFDDPRRDNGRTQMEFEVRFALLSQTPRFPITNFLNLWETNDFVGVLDD